MRCHLRGILSQIALVVILERRCHAGPHFHSGVPDQISAAPKLVFLGRSPEVLAPQSHQELTVACGERFLGKAKTTAWNPCCYAYCVSSTTGSGVLGSTVDIASEKARAAANPRFLLMY